MAPLSHRGISIRLWWLPNVLHMHQRPCTVLQQTTRSRCWDSYLWVWDWVKCDGSVTASYAVLDWVSVDYAHHRRLYVCFLGRRCLVYKAISARDV
ncbi:hypothetical protein BGZ95_007835, partial [Linnemannia exigua]